MNKISLLIIIMTSFILSTTEIYAETNTDDRSNADFFYGELSFNRLDSVPYQNINSFIEKEIFVPTDVDLSAAAFFYGNLIPDPITEVKFKSEIRLQEKRVNAIQSTKGMSPMDLY